MKDITLCITSTQLYLQSDRNIEKWNQSLSYELSATVVNLFHCKQVFGINRCFLCIKHVFLQLLFCSRLPYLPLFPALMMIIALNISECAKVMWYFHENNCSIVICLRYLTMVHCQFSTSSSHFTAAQPL